MDDRERLQKLPTETAILVLEEGKMRLGKELATTMAHIADSIAEIIILKEL